MARIKKLKENGATIYPATIPAAVVDPVTGKKIGELYLSLTGGTLAGDLQFASYGNSGERGIRAVMAGDDYWGIVGRSTENNQGVLEIYTGDDGGSYPHNEMIKFSQYAGARTVESKPVREFVVFDKSGNTSIPGTLSIGSTLTLRGNKGNADVFTDFNGGRGIVLRFTDSSGVLHELGMWNNGTPNYIKGNTRYELYHRGNLGIATSTKSGLVKSGGDISVGSDGTVSASGKALRITNGGVGRYYKFMSFDIGGDKGMIRFGIFSPLLGYGEFLIDWSWQGSMEKHCYPYCLFSTNAQMYNLVKLVRTGNTTFDAYFESNPGNDYATFVFMGQSGTSVKSFSASGVSSIPTVYKESAHAGNLYFGTITGTLAGTADSSKALVSRTETDINADVFKTPGIYVAPISMIDVDTIGFAETVELKGQSIVMTVGQSGTDVRYQYIFVQEEAGSYLYRRMLDPISSEQEAFKYFMPEIPTATSDKAGTVKSGGNIDVDSLGNVAVKGCSFANSNDAINIDEYTQADYGVIPIWLNTAEADGNPPGREGLVFQAKYRSEQGGSGTEYVDCLTQLYVGNEGVRHRTIVDYDEATKFENTPWSKINDDWYFNLGTATVASSTSSSANVTFTGSSAFSSIRTLLDGLSLATMSNAMPNISLGFSLATGNGITHYIRTKVSSISRLSNGNYALFAMYQNPLFGDENYVNVLRISITPSSYSCQTLKSL